MVVMSLGEFLWSLLVIFFMVVYFMMLFEVIVDVFRRHDASGGKKAAWLVFLFVLPFLSLIIYMVTNSEGMTQRGQRGMAFVPVPRRTCRSWGACLGDLECEGAAGQRRDHPGRVRVDQGSRAGMMDSARGAGRGRN